MSCLHRKQLRAGKVRDDLLKVADYVCLGKGVFLAARISKIGDEFGSKTPGGSALQGESIAR
jgi:hypothetical protein